MTSAHRRSSRSLLLPGIVAIAGFGILCGLGFWQVERKTWKEDLIAKLERRIAAPPVKLPPPSDWPALARDDWEFRRVTLSLEFPDAAPAYVYSGGSALRADIKAPGYFVFAPARLASGETVVVNAGFVSERPAPTLTGRREITGYLRWPEPPSLFISSHDQAGEIWFVRDPSAMAQVKGWGAVAPFYIDQEAPLPASGLPRPGRIVVNLPNNHLGYALTWFGLAAGLAGVFAFWLHRQLRDRRIGRMKSASL